MRRLKDASEMHPCRLGYNCCNTSKNNPEKILFTTLLENECTRKAWIAVLNQKEGTSVQSQHTNVKSALRRALP